MPSKTQDSVRAFLLKEKGWTTGLVNALIANVEKTPVKFFVCDDSTSMENEDGKMFVGEGDNKKLVPCTRWAELRETIKFHMKLSSLASAETEFRLLNGAAPIVVGASAEDDATSMPILEALLNYTPSGGTPLCYHISEIVKQITEMAPELRNKGKKAAIIICTDGEPSDGDIGEAMRPLCNLPCYVVIRLCTDQENVITYWDGLIKRLELYMDVLDDPIGEAQQVARSANSWFTYGEPLHRLREFGCPVKEYYGVDVKRFDHDQMKTMCCLLFDQELSDLPHPKEQWKHFIFKISELNDAEGDVWDAANQCVSKWIDIRKLIATYSPSNADTASHIPPPPPLPASASAPAPAPAPTPEPAPAPAPAATATIFDAVFPTQGPMGLSLLPHRVIFTTPGGEAKAISCAIVQQSSFTTQIQPGDALLSVNATALVHVDTQAVIREDTLQPYFDHYSKTISATPAPRSVKFFRLLRSPEGGTAVSTPVNWEEASAIGAAVGATVG
jgi:hypothetical protein